jgi:hypothetical protein
VKKMGQALGGRRPPGLPHRTLPRIGPGREGSQHRDPGPSPLRRDRFKEMAATPPPRRAAGNGSQKERIPPRAPAPTAPAAAPRVLVTPALLGPGAEPEDLIRRRSAGRMERKSVEEREREQEGEAPPPPTRRGISTRQWLGAYRQ